MTLSCTVARDCHRIWLRRSVVPSPTERLSQDLAMTLSCTVAHRATVTVPGSSAQLYRFSQQSHTPWFGMLARTRTCAICACSHVQLAEQKLQKLHTQWAHVTVLN